MSDPLLAVEDLHTKFSTLEGTVHAVNGVSFRVREGEIVGMVGETGSGKSVTAHSIIRLEEPGHITDGSIRFRGTELTTADERTIRHIRGHGMGMVFQDPESTLNPTFQVSEQIAESLKIHQDLGAPEELNDEGDNHGDGGDHGTPGTGGDPGLLDYLHVPGFSDRTAWQDHRQRALDLMVDVGIPRPEERAGAYPHQFSGGMRQRAMLAIALAREPDLLIADEPTSSLDVTIQAQILDRLRQLNETEGMAVLLITHDLAVIAELCDRVIVVDGGEIMEVGTTEQILTDPRHPYTRGLLECLPQTTSRTERLTAIEGEVPDMVGETEGCPFAPRCAFAAEECRTGDVAMVDGADGHRAKCCRLDHVEAEWDRDRPVEPGTLAEKPAGLRSPGPKSDGSSSPGGTSIANTTADADTATDPSTGESTHREAGTPVIEVEGLSKRFTRNDSMLDRLLGDREYVQAVTDVSFSIDEGETLGLVGESGSGKTTVANVIAGLHTPTSGEVRIDGDPVGHATDRPGELLSDVGMVFQHPTKSLDPRMTLQEAIAEPLKIQGWAAERRQARVAELADTVELSEALLQRYPHEVSGGQAQRAAVARAVALDPRVVLLDEPVSALDVSVQAKILNLLMDLQAELDLTYLLIAHDLSVVQHMADRVAVMYLGRLMEIAPPDHLFANPTHPYTAALLSAIPRVDPTADADERIILEADVPSPVNPPSGCAFHTRCPVAEDECESTAPPFEQVGEAHSRCHFAGDF